MIVCPNCKNQEIEGAIYCSHCGAELTSPKRESASAAGQETIAVSKEVFNRQIFTRELRSQSASDVNLHILDSGQILPLSGSQEYILGRGQSEQAQGHVVDLADFQAYEKGVSRVHAALMKVETGYQLVDLGSSNGTRLNGALLTPQQTYPLRHGDIISLGKLKVQILIRK